MWTVTGVALCTLTRTYIPAYMCVNVTFHLNPWNMRFLMEGRIKPNKCYQFLWMFQTQYKCRTLLIP